MKINCIACGHRFEMDESYDDYHGLVKCSICRCLLQLCTEGGKVKSVDLSAQRIAAPSPAADQSPKRQVA